MSISKYKFGPALNVYSGGYDGELVSIEKDDVVLFEGAIGPSSKKIKVKEETTTDESGSATYEYVYRDSDSASNSNSSKVKVKITDEWTAEYTEGNVLNIHVTTTINSIKRYGISGNPGTSPRRIRVRRTKNGKNYVDYTGSPSTAETIATNVSLGSHTFTLDPGEDASASTVYYWNTFANGPHADTPTEGDIYTDLLGIGIEFTNIQPKDYRPGKHRINGKWYTHNRDPHGHCDKRVGGKWVEMRTVADAPDLTNPPVIRRSGKWISQALIGDDSTSV